MIDWLRGKRKAGLLVIKQAAEKAAQREL